MTAAPGAATRSRSGSGDGRPGRPRRHGWPVSRAGLRRAAVALLAGVLLTAAFPPYGLWPAAPLAVAALAWCLQGRGIRVGAGLGWLFGLGFLLPLLHWTGVYVGPVPWLILGVFESLFLAALGGLSAVAQRLPGWPLWAACLWVAQEAARDRLPFGGFPWGRLAFSQAASPYVRLASLGGAPLVTFAVALSGTLLAAAVLTAARTPARPARRPVLATLAVLAAAVIGALGLAVPTSVPDGPTRTVAVIQGNVPRLGLDFNSQREAVLRNHVQQTLVLAADVKAGRLARPQLVIWPEDSSDIDPFEAPSAYALIEQAVHAVGVPILIGTLTPAPGNKLDNVGIVWSPTTGPGARYVKRHPVPFGEYIPLRSIARKISADVNLVPRDFAMGSKPGVLQVGPARIGDVICFEVAYDGLVNDVVRGGGQLIVVQTNNATFGHTPQTYQQLAMARLRAVEHGRTVLVAATSGVSAIIAPDGHVAEQSTIFSPDVLVDSVRLSDTRTLATRIGTAPEWALTGFGLLGALGGWVRGRRTAPDVDRPAVDTPRSGGRELVDQEVS